MKNHTEMRSMLLLVILVTALTIALIPSVAVATSASYKLTYETNDDGLVITGYEGQLRGELVIPDGTTAIGPGAFSQCADLRLVRLPQGIQTIGASAFRYCSSLTSIAIPDSVKAIGDHAFAGTGLTSVEIPDSVESIGDYAFEYCANLTDFTIPQSATSLGRAPFNSCSKLAKVTIEAPVASLVDSFFSGLGALRSVVLPDTLESVSGSMFYGCRSLMQVNLPDGVETIGSSAFRYCSSLTSIAIPDSVVAIGDHAFAGTGLTSIELPAGVESIGDYAFEYCDSLESAFLPDTLRHLGDSPFYSTSVKRIAFGGSATQWDQIGGKPVYDGVSVEFGVTQPTPNPPVVDEPTLSLIPLEETWVIKLDHAPIPAGQIVHYAVWSEEDGQDDIAWYSATKEGASWVSRLDAGRHPGNRNVFVHAYAGPSDRPVDLVMGAKFNPGGNRPNRLPSVSVQNLGGSSYRLIVRNVGSASRVQLPTWSEADGQDDIVWYEAEDEGNGTWSQTVDTSMHGGGKMITHVYADGRAMAATSYTTPVSERPTVSVQALGDTRYRVSVRNMREASHVQMPTWSDVGGQDDIIWYDAINEGNGTWSITMDMVMHGRGNTTTHIYADGRFVSAVSYVTH